MNRMIYLQEKTMLGELRRVVWKRKFLILFVFVFVVSSGMFVTFLITPKYEAQMSLIVSRQHLDPSISAGEEPSQASTNSISDEEFNSELELIKNSEVLIGAAKELDLINNQAPKPGGTLSRWRKSVRQRFSGLLNDESIDEKTSQPDEFALEKIANQMSDNLDVEPVKKSRIIKINYTDTDPVRAKETLEAIYKNYLALHIRMNEKTTVTEVFDKQTDDYGSKLKSSTDQLKSFDQSNGVTGGENGSQSEIVLRQFYETQKQADQARTEINETIERIAELKKKIAEQPEQIQTGSTSKYVGALDGMKNDLIQLNQEKTRLLQKYKPGTRFVLEIEDRIKNLEQAIAREAANPPQERSFALNDLRRRLQSDLSTAQVSLSALKTRETELQEQADKQRIEAARLNQKGIERERLERDRKINEEAYMLYQKKTRQSEVGEVLNRQEIPNVGIADPPRTDGEKKTPKTTLNFLILLFLGVFGGLAAALAAEKMTNPVQAQYYLPPVSRFGNILPKQMKLLNRKSDKTTGGQNQNHHQQPGMFANNGDDEKLAEIANYFQRQD